MLAAVVLLSWSVLAAHGPVAGGHMGAAMGETMAVCLAVIQGAVVVQGTRRILRARSRPAPVPFPPAEPAVLLPRVAWSVLPRARAGPERLQVFRL